MFFQKMQKGESHGHLFWQDFHGVILEPDKISNLNFGGKQLKT
jgi:hypothetical protein